VLQQQVFAFAAQMANFVYIIADAHTREAVVVDAAWDVPGVLRVLKVLLFPPPMRNAICPHAQPACGTPLGLSPAATARQQHALPLCSCGFVASWCWWSLKC